MHQVMKETLANTFKHVDEFAAKMNPMEHVATKKRNKAQEDKLWAAMTTTPEHIAKPLIGYLAEKAKHNEKEQEPCALCQLIDKRSGVK